MTSLDRSENLPPAKMEEISQDHSAESSQPPSRNGQKSQKEKHRVQWNRGGETLDSRNKRATFELPSDGTSEEEDRESKSPPQAKGRIASRKGTSPRLVPQSAAPDLLKSSTSASVTRQKTPILRKQSVEEDKEGDTANEGEEEEGEDENSPKSQNEEEDSDAIRRAAGKAFSQQSAQQRAERLSRTISTRSAPGSRYTSPIRNPPKRVKYGARSPPPSPPPQGQQLTLDLSDIPLEKLETKRTYGIQDESEDEKDEENPKKKGRRTGRIFHTAARRLIKHHTRRGSRQWFKVLPEEPLLKSGQTTPVAERDPDDYVPRPKQYREGVLGSLMKLYNEQGLGSALANIPLGNDAINRSAYQRKDISQPLVESSNSTPTATPVSSHGHTFGSFDSSGSPSPGGTSRKAKSKWYQNPKPHSTGSISELVSSSTSLAQPAGSQPGAAIRPKKKQRPLSAQAMNTVLGRHKGPKVEEAIKLQVHLADTIQRKAYLLKICRALMTYGAPTHRLEEYMRMSARVLEIDSQFLYMPGCMIISFGDAAWHTTDVRIVRCAQAVNLSKLYDAHAIYKEVIHDMIGVEEAITRLDEINSRKNHFNKWLLILVYGLASVCVGPFAFSARPIDLPIAFILGSLLGFMQLIVAPRSDLYANIFEISAAVLTSFLARAFGSINHGKTFCFSALAQSSIALILPGYTVLCGSLELQSKNIVAGSVRMVYAIIYSLFLGFGITVGTSIYGAIDPSATSATTCTPTYPFWYSLLFVLPFTACLTIINHSPWKKTPPMLGLSLIGYIVNHYSAQRFASNAQIAQTLGALAIGVCANLYSRLRHGLAAAVLLPAIFVQVPSGLAASGSLISGVSSANLLTNHTDGGQGDGGVTDGAGAGPGGGGTAPVNSAVLSVGYSMIQIAIGITVGLFMSALVVYPLGKRRSGLFSF